MTQRSCRIGLALALAILPAPVFGQECGGLRLEHLYDLPSDCAGITLTMRPDANGRPYLYVAAKEAGLKIYDLRGAPQLVQTLPASDWQGLDLFNLSQSGRYLYLALGNSFARAKQSPGLAVVDVADPARARVLSVWSDPELRSGAGVVECAGDYAYLGAMMDGLMILDVRDKTAIRRVSAFVPDIHFPDEKADPEKINARGLAVRGSLVYLCYDAGGMRIINVADKARPREVGRYSNPVMNGKPRAYNNIVLDGALAYVTVDYCGLEILDINNPADIREVSWWNPWDCQESGWKWFSSPGHANELAFDPIHTLLFLATGKSDMHVLDVQRPEAPSLCQVYGGPDNEMGTWGVSAQAGRIFLSYICTLGIPFRSRWTGVQVLRYERDRPPPSGMDLTPSGN